jgi:hypothetical protein
MSEHETVRNDASVATFLDAVADERQRADAWRLVALMREVTGEEPAMWGGQYRRLWPLPLSLRQRPPGRLAPVRLFRAQGQVEHLRHGRL